MTWGNGAMGEVLEYSYRLKVWKLLMGMILFAAAAYGMGYFAANNEDGIRFYRLITVSPVTATVILWIITAASAALAAMFVAMIASGATKKTYHIRLTPTEFTAPGGFLKKKIRTVRLSEIRDIGVTSVHGQHFLEVRTPDGKIGVTHQDIGKPAFDELANALAERVAALRGG